MTTRKINEIEDKIKRRARIKERKINQDAQGETRNIPEVSTAIWKMNFHLKKRIMTTEEDTSIKMKKMSQRLNRKHVRKRSRKKTCQPKQSMRTMAKRKQCH